MSEKVCEYTTKRGRTVKLTDRLRQHLESTKSKAVHKARKRLLQDINEVRKEATGDKTDFYKVQEDYKKVKAQHNEFLIMQEDERKDLHEDDVEMYDELYMDETLQLDADNKAIQETILQAQVTHKDSVSRAGQSNGTSRVSRGSGRSRHESLIEQRMKSEELRLKKEALLAQAKLDDEQRKLEQAQQELQRKKELAELDTQMKVSQAKIEILETASNASEGGRSSHSAHSRESVRYRQGEGGNQRDQVDTGHSERGFLPDPRNHSTPQEGERTRSDPMLCRVVEAMERSQRNALQIEPTVFGGEPLEYQTWRQSFEELIEKDVKPARRLLYLRKYTSGPALDAVNSLKGLSPTEAYEQAMKTLENRYGGAFPVYEAYLQKLRDWPTVKSGDADALRKYADFLAACEVARKQISLLEILNDPMENLKLAKKLPKTMANDWARKVDRDMHDDSGNEKGYPKFKKFVDFVQAKARLESGPVQRALNERSAEAPRFTKTVKVNLTDIKEEPSAEVAYCNYASTAPAGMKQKPTCLNCNIPGHELGVCRKFAALPAGDRYRLTKDKKICRNCMEGGHIARVCPSEKRCEICGKRHHKLFHDDNYVPRAPKTGKAPEAASEKAKPEEQATVNATSTMPSWLGDAEPEAAREPLPSKRKDVGHIVKLQIYARGDSSIRKEVYAVIDPQSNSCFMREDVMRGMPLNYTDVSLRTRTMIGESLEDSKKIHDLMIETKDGKVKANLKELFTKASIAADHEQIPDPDDVRKWEHLEAIKGELCEVDKSIPIGLLIGRVHASLIKPRGCIPGDGDDPYAVKTMLGWGVVGNLAKQERDKEVAWTAKTDSAEIKPGAAIKLMAQEFQEIESEDRVSIEDKRFIKKMDESVRFENGHVTLPLPLKDEEIQAPCNKHQAAMLLERQKERLMKDEQYRNHYTEFMDKLIKQGFAERVTGPARPGREWYLPHHGVYHPRKKDKLRVVFNCSVEYKGFVLNRHLLKGPDLTNNLVGVLARFRRKKRALTCDIEAMFHQVKVEEDDRDFLRFFWWPDSDFTKEPEVYRMTVHLFGATSSPGCANYALKHVAQLFKEEASPEAVKFLEENFYVDDGLDGDEEAEDTIRLARDTQELCAKGGFRLHKFLSNDRKVLESIKVEDRNKELQSLDLGSDALPREPTLGSLWDAENDLLLYKATLPQKPATRRGILSAVSSIYDPLGLIAPFILKGKMILQELCHACKDWDQDIPKEIAQRWVLWKEEAVLLEEIKIRRCYFPEDFGKPVRVEFHHFSDASNRGYGQCSYIRAYNEQGRIATALIMAKARVTPKKKVTIPRLELAAALVSARVSRFLGREMKMEAEHYFWTDSQIVLAYLRNESLRLHLFAANRVQTIRDITDVKRWNYVETERNPADLASRGASPDELSKDPLWLYGPDFLRGEAPPPESPVCIVPEDDPEVHKSASMATESQEIRAVELTRRFGKLSSWHNMIKAASALLRLKEKLVHRQCSVKSKRTSPYQHSTAAQRRTAEKELLKLMQREDYSDEMDKLRHAEQGYKGSKPKKGDHRFRELDAFLDQEGCIRVGGRLKRSSLPFYEKHPMIVSGHNPLTAALIRDHHCRVLHGGRSATIHSLRSHGVWVTGASAAVDRIKRKCVHCRRYRAEAEGQRMAELPEARVEPSAPFTTVGVDVFGPYHVKQGRARVKRYGVLFTCMALRAVHIEVAKSLSTEDFLLAYRRMVARRGPARELWCDRGTNLVGASNELKKEVNEMLSDKTKGRLAERNCDLVTFRFNPPCASHMGGVWERQIRSVRNALTSLLDEHHHMMDEDLLATVMCEAEAIVNSRPLTVVDSSDSDAPVALSPAQILTMKPKVSPPLPGKYDRPDVYARCRWRRSQRLAEEFWRRWRLDYLQALQPRKKWQKARRCLREGDIVLMVQDNAPRCDWKMARIIKTKVSQDGLVRTVTIKGRDGIYDRPVHKLVVLIPIEEP